MTLRRPITMEALLVWAVQRQRADIGTQAAGRVGPADFTGRVSADGVYACLCQGELGTAVDCVGSWRHDTGAWLHPDAETVYRLANALPVPTNFQVLGHARTATRPDWLAERRIVETYGELRSRNGAPTGKVRYVANPGERKQWPWCRLFYRQNWDAIVSARGLYRAWWCGLRDLSVELQNGIVLSEHAVTEIGAPATPWKKNS